MYNFAQHPPQCHNTRPKAIGREFVRPAAAKHRQPGQGPAQARPAARAEPAARSAHSTRRTHAARLVYHCRAPRARPARSSRRPCRPSRRLPSSPLQRPRGDQRARHARSVRQSSAHPQPACARHGCQLATRPRAELQRAARARVGHPAGAAAAAAAAAACPGARGAAVPARAPRLTRALDALHVWDACPALALAQGAALRAFPMGLGSSRHRLLASSSRQPYRHALVISHVPVIPHGRQWSHRREGGGRRPWGALGRRGGTTKSRWHGQPNCFLLFKL